MTMLRRWRPMCACVVLFMWAIGSGSPISAQVPRTITYSGYLVDSGGTPITNPALSITFSLYSAAMGGPAVYAETQSVNVIDGVFAAIIGSLTPFPPSLTFASQYYLGVKVGADAEMTPRLTLASSPYALRAAGVENGSISLPNLNASGAGSNKFLATDGTNMAWVNPSGVQQVSGIGGLTGGGPGQANVSIAVAPNGITQSMLSATGGTNGQVLSSSNGALQWTTPASGSVTSVTATSGGGLVTSPGGGITSSGSVGIAAGGVQTAMLADSAVTTAKLATAQQLPNCSDGQVVQRLGGTWICTNLPPITTELRHLPGMGWYAQRLAVALGGDGLPWIAYSSTDAFDGGGGAGKVTWQKCANLPCTSFSQRGSFSVSTSNVAMALGIDGLPVLSAGGGNNPPAGLTVIKVTGAGSFTSHTIDATSGAGFGTSIRIGADGFPVVAHIVSGVGLKVVKCTTADCSGAVTATAFDADAYHDTAMVIPTDTLPAIAYCTLNNSALKFIKCANTACTAAIQRTLDSVPCFEKGVDMAIGADGFPVISYSDGNVLKIAKCNDASCAPGFLVKTVDSQAGFQLGIGSSIVIPSDGHPVLSYVASSAGPVFTQVFSYDASSVDQIQTRMARCSDTSCSSAVVTPVGLALWGYLGDPTFGTSIVLPPPRNLPLVTFLTWGPPVDAISSRLVNTILCTNPTCVYP